MAEKKWGRATASTKLFNFDRRSSRKVVEYSLSPSPPIDVSSTIEIDAVSLALLPVRPYTVPPYLLADHRSRYFGHKIILQAMSATNTMPAPLVSAEAMQNVIDMLMADTSLAPFWRTFLDLSLVQYTVSMGKFIGRVVLKSAEMALRAFNAIHGFCQSLVGFGDRVQDVGERVSNLASTVHERGTQEVEKFLRSAPVEQMSEAVRSISRDLVNAAKAAEKCLHTSLNDRFTRGDSSLAVKSDFRGSGDNDSSHGLEAARPFYTDQKTQPCGGCQQVFPLGSQFCNNCGRRTIFNRG